MSDNNKFKNNNNIQENTIITPYNHSEKDLLLNPEMNYILNPLHIIGPLYIVGGCIGIISGISAQRKGLSSVVFSGRLANRISARPAGG